MKYKIPQPNEPVHPEYTRLLDEIDRLAERLDRQFRIPLTNVRFGWDPVVGFVPIAGDLVTASLAFKIILTARRLGADKALIRRMAANSATDIAFGLVPIIGTLFDIFYRSNVRNMDMLKDHIRNRRTPAA